MFEVIKIKDEIRNSGNQLNCAQQVLLQYSERYGLHHDMAIKIAAAFGGGISGMGETCGAVTGAFMVIGLKCGSKKDDKEANEEKNRLIREFLTEFKSRFVSIKCKELLGLDPSIPEERKMIEETKLTETRCPKFINNSIQILHNLLNNA